jgi:hypothetical protein
VSKDRATKAQRVCWGKPPHILDVGIRWRLRPLSLRGYSCLHSMNSWLDGLHGLPRRRGEDTPAFARNRTLLFCSGARHCSLWVTTPHNLILPTRHAIKGQTLASCLLDTVYYGGPRSHASRDEVGPNRLLLLSHQEPGGLRVVLEKKLGKANLGASVSFLRTVCYCLLRCCLGACLGLLNTRRNWHGDRFRQKSRPHCNCQQNIWIMVLWVATT